MLRRRGHNNAGDAARGWYLEGGVDEAQVGVVLGLRVHARPNQVLDRHLHLAQVHATAAPRAGEEGGGDKAAEQGTAGRGRARPGGPPAVLAPAPHSPLTPPEPRLPPLTTSSTPAPEPAVLVHQIAVPVLLGHPLPRPAAPGPGAGARLVAHAVQGVEHGHVCGQRLLRDHVAHLGWVGGWVGRGGRGSWRQRGVAGGGGARTRGLAHHARAAPCPCLHHTLTARRTRHTKYSSGTSLVRCCRSRTCGRAGGR